MKVSYNWLRNYLDQCPGPDKVAEMLTGCGLEIEGMEVFHSVKGGLRGCVVGEVMTCERHPNSDHLSLTTVSTGAPETLRVVCGASNVAAGQKVIVATVGTRLFFHDKEIVIQKSKIRGEPSEGMICAEDELGIGTSHDGILVLPDHAKPGTPASEWFNIEEDVVFTIGLTPNRVDAASHTGVARDLVAVINNFGRHEIDAAKKIYLKLPDVSGFETGDNSRRIGVVIEDPLACRRYSGVTISGITVAESPAWLKNRLLSIGLTPINNIVDITNFVLMELGQPLHAFDCAQITGDIVYVKKHPSGTRFVTLDGVERELSDNDLMISNAEEPMCIGGVYGGKKSGVTATTTEIFLESACFDPSHIRRTAKLHGLQTDASFRFERGTDVNATVYALKRASQLILGVAGGRISSEIVDIYPAVLPPVQVSLRYGYASMLMGREIPTEVIESILQDLGTEFIATSGAKESGDLTWTVGIPASKVDVTREADVVEEILRIYGYNNIEMSGKVIASLSQSPQPDPRKSQDKASDYLSAHGFHEIMTNSLTRSAYYTGYPDFTSERSVVIRNPISRDLDVMRQTLLFGALESLVYNQNRKVSDIRFYEFGTVYCLDQSPGNPVPGYREEKHLSVLLSGRKEPESWNTNEHPVDFAVLKGHVDMLFRLLAADMKGMVQEPYSSATFPAGLRYSIGGQTLVTMGTLAEQITRQFDIRQPVLYAEINWVLLFSLIPRKLNRYRELPRYPEVRRDLALLVDQSVSFDALEKMAFLTERKLLKKVGLFDVYEGEKLEAGKKSYALSFILQDEDRTLTDKEIDRTMERLVRAFESGFNARLR